MNERKLAKITPKKKKKKKKIIRSKSKHLEVRDKDLCFQSINSKIIRQKYCLLKQKKN